DPVLRLKEELPDAIVREIVAILRPEAFVHNDESIPADLLEQTVVVPAPDDVGVLDPLEPGRITGGRHARGGQAERLLDAVARAVFSARRLLLVDRVPQSDHGLLHPQPAA